MTGTFCRRDAVESLRTQHFDVLVIGGGITGMGVVLDAASRGLRAALIERDDFSSGTSSKSSKMIHGGLRYLQQGDVRLVYEALAERQRLLDNAPHLVKPLPFVIPMFGKGGVIPAKIARLLGSAMWAYDLTGGFRLGRLHKRLTKAEVLDAFPTVREQNLVSGYLYFDAAADDARLVTALARTAVLHYGATIANYVTATGVMTGSAGQVCGVLAQADGEPISIAAKAVVNACGVWADDVRALDEQTHPDSIRPAKGVHIVVPHRLVQNTAAVVIPVPKDRRSVFVVPHGDLCYIGTTDTDYDGPLDNPQCSAEDIAYLLRAINASCTTTISATDIVGTWAGLRPLVKSAHTSRTADLSRGHQLTTSPSGLITITGGKLTTYRHMAKDTVDVVARAIGRRDATRSQTATIRLRGADGFDGAAELAKQTGLSHPTAEHLADRYGGEVTEILALIAQDSSLAEPLVPGLKYVRAEAIFAARYEMAHSVDDVLSRRTRARLFACEASIAAAHDVAELIAPELNWTPDQARHSAESFIEIARADLAATHTPVPASPASAG